MILRCNYDFPVSSGNPVPGDHSADSPRVTTTPSRMGTLRRAVSRYVAISNVEYFGAKLLLRQSLRYQSSRRLPSLFSPARSKSWRGADTSASCDTLDKGEHSDCEFLES